MSCKLEPAVWSSDTGQRIPCFDRCQQDNHMTLGGHIVYLWPEYHHLRPRSAWAQMILRGTQINYMPDKSHLVIFIINTQSQIVQIHLN